MAFTNFDTKEINCKIVYFGATNSGKTENLRSIFKRTSSEIRSGILELGDGEGHTRFFDFLPISLGTVRDYHIKLHLFTLPTNPMFETVRSVILKGIDGAIFVVDSQIDRLADNLEAWQEMRKIFETEGISATEIPRIVQYNKRDLNDIIPIDILNRELNPDSVPEHEAIATKAIGTMESLQQMAKMVVDRLAP